MYLNSKHEGFLKEKKETSDWQVSLNFNSHARAEQMV